MLRKFSIILFLLLLLSSVSDSPQERYIAQFSEIAVREMYRSGVPASITLAQGLLESRYGLSALAAKGNNHFGIKCHDWKGKSMKFDDDAKGECFRVYDSAEESFADHSDFLRYRDRYKFLFDYKTDDYKAWAYGLKKAGYATDPAYATKLIKIIEDYKLSRFDSMKPDDVFFEDEENVSTEVGAHRQNPDNHVTKKALAKKKASKKKKKSQKTDIPDQLPQPPLRMEEVRLYEKSGETFLFALQRKVYSKNGVPFVYSVEGDSYSSLAHMYNLFDKEILRFNDISSDRNLLPGTVVYIQPKKKSTQKGLDKYVVESDGEQLRDIAQRFAVKLSSLYKMNSMSASSQLKEGDMIVLRK